MGINVQLEDEEGKCVELLDAPLPQSLNLHNIPFYRSAEFPLVSGIDPHGDTIFNRLQVERSLAEWEMLTELVDRSGRLTMEEVSRLARACRNGVHLHLRFTGD